MNHRTRKFIDGLLSGLGAPGEVYVTKKHKRPHANSLERMRSDWERIGMDLRTVIGRENVDAPSQDRSGA